jgi:hypothetical protein
MPAGVGSAARLKFNYIASCLRFRFMLLPVFLGVGYLATGQVKFSTVVSSKEIGRNDYVQIEFVVENAKEIEHMNPPAFAGFRVVQGPIQSSGMSIVNGNMSQYKSLSFVLQPTKAGKFLIAGAAATVDGKPMESNSVTIEVSTAASVNPVQPQVAPQPSFPGEPLDIDREYVLKPGENPDAKIRKNLFVRLQVSKTNCYVGEPIVATYKLYSRLQSESRVTRHPSLNGFSVYDMVDPNRDAPSVENVNGRNFTVHTIRKAQLIPLQAGTVDLDLVEIENTVHFIQTNGQRHHASNPIEDLLDQFGEDESGIPVEKNITLDSKPVTITVRPLPSENRPADFDGAVGRFSLDAAIDKKNIAANDAAILKITVKGSGNLPVVNAPAVLWPSEVESYGASEKENIDKSTAPLGGTKTFEYTFVPKKKGDYNIPPISLSFFDPALGAYKTVRTEPLDLRVNPGKKSSSLAPGERQVLSKPGEKQGLLHVLEAHLEWIFAILILSALAIYLFVQNRRLRKKEAEAVALAAMAEEVKPVHEPVSPLEPARQMLASGEYKAFYAELSRVLWKALSERLELPYSAMNKTRILELLRQKGLDEANRERLTRILRECEMSLYTPSYDTQDMQALLAQTEALLRNLGVQPVNL